MSVFPKLKVYVQLLTPGCQVYVNPKGDWIDVRAAKDVFLKYPQAGVQHMENGDNVRNVTFSNELVPLGIRVLLPKGCEADLKPRSGTYEKFRVILANHVGTIDWPYNGPQDEWKMNLISFGKCIIRGPKEATPEDWDFYYSHPDKITIIDGVVCGDRIGQFRVNLSQKASFRDKLRWLFSSGIEIVYVDNIDTVENRNGFSSSGVH